MSVESASHFIVVPPKEQLAGFIAKERFSAYLSAHFPGYAFLVTDRAPFESDDFQLIPILGKASDTPDPDGGVRMLAPPERAVLDEIFRACRRFEVSRSCLS